MIAQDLIAALEGGYSVLTPTARLARELRRDFARTRVDAGNTSWRSPEIQSVSAWLRARFDELTWHGPGAAQGRMLLSTPAAEALWKRIIVKQSSGLGLMDIPAATRLAFGAWKLSHEWQLPDPGAAALAAEDLKQFSTWMRVYHRTTMRQNFIDDARLPGVVRNAIQDGIIGPGRLALHAFGAMSPQLDALWQAIVDRDGEVVVVERDPIEGRAIRVELLNEREELEYAARWARGQLESLGEKSAIGVVVPGLSHRTQLVERVFERVFSPADTLPGAGDRRKGYLLVSRRPVAENPAGAAALAVLQLARRRIDLESIRTVVLSPFLKAADNEHIARAEFAAWLGRYPRSRTGLDQLARRAALWAGDRDNPFELAKLLDAVAAQSGDGKKQKPGTWGNHFGRMLNAAGWPGATLDVDGAAAREAVRTALADMGSLDPVLTAIGVDEALAQFRQFLNVAELTGDRSPYPVRIVEPDVAQGMHFDATWICGWTIDAFPRAAEPNPFIPQAWAREKRVPGFSAARMLEDAQRVTARLLGSAADIVVSWPKESRHAENQKSSLISHLEDIPKADIPVWGGPDPAAVAAGSARAESLSDASGPPLAATRAPGGTRALKLQAACPFRAFATCRLGASASRTVGAGLDALERGSLVHSVLEMTWRSLGSHGGLLATSRDDIERQLSDFADRALSRTEVSRGPLPSRFRDMEQRRLTGLVLDWLDVERARQSFVVVAEESERILTLGGLEFSLVPDRIDRVDDAGFVLIDYKTSKSNSEKKWAGPRPDEPQLPLYVLTLDEPALAVLFAEVRSDRMRFRGVAKMEGLVPGVGKFKGLDREDLRWDELRDYWRGHLEGLARAFRRGHAAVDPKNRVETCRHCDLDALCRISEHDRTWVNDA